MKSASVQTAHETLGTVLFVGQLFIASYEQCSIPCSFPVHLTLLMTHCIGDGYISKDELKTGTFFGEKDFPNNLLHIICDSLMLHTVLTIGRSIAMTKPLSTSESFTEVGSKQTTPAPSPSEQSWFVLCEQSVIYFSLPLQITSSNTNISPVFPQRLRCVGFAANENFPRYRQTTSADLIPHE